MPAKKVPCRIDGIVAAEANQAVIFRRGPNRFWQQLVWDLDSNKVILGHWIKGVVRTHKSDVSPDGRYLVLAVSNYSVAEAKAPPGIHPSQCCGWTAISRPPYYTALALWFSGSSYCGGGLWKGNRELWLNSHSSWDEHIAPSEPVKVRYKDTMSLGEEPIFTMRLKKTGWLQKRELVVRETNPNLQAATMELSAYFGDRSNWWPNRDLDRLEELSERAQPRPVAESTGLLEKNFERGVLVREQSIDAKRYPLHRWALRDLDGKEHRAWKVKYNQIQWLDVDAAGRPIFGEHGCLWAWSGFPDGEPKMIADLNENKFEAIPSPAWAREW